MDQKYGKLNAHNIGIVMKEMVRRVILSIRRHRFAFEVTEKKGYDGNHGDLFTNADRAAQKIYVEMIRENFPGFGVVAEEDHLSIEPKEGFGGVYFTVDPLDGTKAFVRRQSQGIGTMIALVYKGEVIAAYVGDVMTEEVYGFRPESKKVHRISEFGHAAQLSLNTKDLASQYVSLREDPRDYSDHAREIIDKFRSITVTGGSIGIHAAQLWKGVVGGILLPPSFETPWDSTPVFGISRKLGYKFYAIQDSGIQSIDPKLPMEPEKREYELLIASPKADNLL